MATRRRPINPEALQRIRDFLEAGLDDEDEALLKQIEEQSSSDESNDEAEKKSAENGEKVNKSKKKRRDGEDSDYSVGSEDFGSHAGSDSSASDFTCSEHDSELSSDGDDAAYNGKHRKDKKKKVSKAEKEARRTLRDEDKREKHKQSAKDKIRVPTVPAGQDDDTAVAGKKHKRRQTTEAEIRSHNMLKRHAGPSAMAALSPTEAEMLSQAARISRAQLRAVDSTAALKVMEQKYEDMSLQTDDKTNQAKPKGRARGTQVLSLASSSIPNAPTASEISAVLAPILEATGSSALSTIEKMKNGSSGSISRRNDLFECMTDKLLIHSYSHLASSSSTVPTVPTSGTSSIVKDVVRRPSVKSFVSDETSRRIEAIQNTCKRQAGQKYGKRESDDDDEDDNDKRLRNKKGTSTGTSKALLSLGFDSENQTFQSLFGEDVPLSHLQAIASGQEIRTTSHRFISSLHNPTPSERQIPLFRTHEILAFL